MSEPTNVPTRPKHVTNIGRWRIAWRIGHYRTGWHRYQHGGHFTFALPFLWVSGVRRNFPAVPPKEKT